MILNQIQIDASMDTTIVQQIKQQIIWLIASGKLQPGDKLPAIRQTAKHFSINMHTVHAAYQKLESEGWVKIRQGMGTRVREIQPGILSRMAGVTESHTIGVILPSINNPFYQSMLEGLEESLDEEQPLLFVCSTHDDPHQVDRYYSQLAVKSVDGILVISHALPESMINGFGLPVIQVDWPGISTYSVNMDLENAGYLAGKHLLDHRYRSIGMITYSEKAENIKPVENGFKRAMHEGGHILAPDHIVCVNGFHLEQGAEGMEKLLRSVPDLRAVFAISDTLAIGAMNRLKRKGYRIPDDMGVVGFNNIQLAELVEPALTTVNAPAYRMGVEAMKMLQKMIKNTLPVPKQVVLETNLIIRRSCGSHPG